MTQRTLFINHCITSIVLELHTHAHFPNDVLELVYWLYHNCTAYIGTSFTYVQIACVCLDYVSG